MRSCPWFLLDEMSQYSTVHTQVHHQKNNQIKTQTNDSRNPITMWTPVESNSPSSNKDRVILWERRTCGLCVNTAETILPSELTEKTHLCWGETDDQRGTCKGEDTRAKEGGGGWAETWRRQAERGEKLKGGRTDRLPSVPCRDRWRVRGQKTGEIETRGKNEAIKGSEGRSCTKRLKPGRTGRTEALEFFQHGLMGPLCPPINHCEME